MADEKVEAQCPYCGAVGKGKMSALEKPRQCPKCKRKVSFRILKGSPDRSQSEGSKSAKPTAFKECVSCGQSIVEKATLCCHCGANQTGSVDSGYVGQCSFCGTTEGIAYTESFYKIAVLNTKESADLAGIMHTMEWRLAGIIDGAICRECLLEKKEEILRRSFSLPLLRPKPSKRDVLKTSLEEKEGRLLSEQEYEELRESSSYQ